MPRKTRLVIVATAVITGLLSFSAFSLDNQGAGDANGPVECTAGAGLCSWSAPAFNGTSLAGWHVQGSGNWNADQGEIVGSVKPGSGWLLLDHGYEDFEVRFSFRCNNCETGLLFRSKNADNGTSGDYMSLSGSNIGAVSKMILDPQGKEVDQTPIAAPNGRDNQPVQLTLNPDGWNEVQIFVRDNIVTGTVNDQRLGELTISGAKPAPPPPLPSGSSSLPQQGLNFLGGSTYYGLVGLRIAGGAGAEVRIKDISFADLTQRQALPAHYTSPDFRERELTDLFYSEGMAVGDLNHNGVKDVVAGAFYYVGPDYKVAREIFHSQTYDPSEKNATSDSNSMDDWVYDFNGDGWPDVLQVDPRDRWHVILYINPRGEDRHWDAYTVINSDPDAFEAPIFTPIVAGGRPVLLMAQGRGANGQICYAEPDYSDPTKPWTIHLVSEKGPWGPHGGGVGDIVGNGHMDILHDGGWWEPPPAGDTGLWKFHAAPWSAGAQMFVYDVNGDGLPDVVTSIGAHGWGLAWFEQQRDSQGVISWKRHLIMGSADTPPNDRQQWEETDKSVAFSELHSMTMADMNGDGLQDIITGKRWWAHGDRYALDPGAYGDSVLYWFQLVRKPGGEVEFIPHLINNNSGVGDQIMTVDLTGKGKPDILTSTRRGSFIFFNNIPSQRNGKP
jgi:hypothetical protein